MPSGVHADGPRETHAPDAATAEDGAHWLALPRSLIARGLSGIQLLISDAPMAPPCRARAGSAAPSAVAAEPSPPCRLGWALTAV
ncbi:transposase [Streptomyces sp. NPDC001351]|uniref:transposase n=1 Tax=Streptomyces sp. NPDC001351 TaxID=3364564 RepID=UPI0036B5D15D